MKYEKDLLLKELMAYHFSIIELNLYLDTHPEDKRALDLYNEYVLKNLELRKQYESTYGPLTACLSQSKYPWQWTEGSWPWEKDFM